MYVGSVDAVQLEKSNNFCSISYFSFLIFESDYMCSYKCAYNCKFWALKNVCEKCAFFILHQNVSGISCRWVLRKLDKGSDVLPLIRDQKDPRVAFETKHLPKDLSAEDKQSEVKIEVYTRRIKMYVNRETELGANMVKV